MMYGFITDNALEQVGRRRPVDHPHRKKPAIEPGLKQMDEVRFHQRGARRIPHREQVRAHLYKSRGPSRREVQAAEHFLSRRFHDLRSEEHTSELQSLMRISYAV